MAGSTVRVLAIDPGLKTGVCLIDTDDHRIVFAAIIPNGLPGLQDWYFNTTRELSGMHINVLVCESFELEEGTHGVDLTPVGIIDWIKSGGMSTNIYSPTVQWQRRNQRGKTKLVSTAVLKRAGLYPKRGELKEGHQVAALQHALAYLIKIRHRPTIELLHPKEG